MDRMKDWRAWLKWSVRLVAGGFVLLHAYALALIILPVPGTLVMAERAMSGETVRRKPVPLEQISPNLVRAVIAAEDSRFCQHHGVDTEAIDQALEEYRKGEGLRGASTITQQTAKNVFFWNGGGVPRKLGDMWMGTFIDGVWGKRRVMEAYLNVAEWGDGLFGAEAAARARFGKSAADLTEREAALLAAVLPSPNKWRVDPPGPYVSQRAGTLQARMRVVRNEGLAECVLGKETPVRYAPTPAPAQPSPEPKDEDLVADDTPPAAPAEEAEPDEFDDFLEEAQQRFDEASDAPGPDASSEDPEPMDLRPADVGSGASEDAPED